MIPWAFIAVLAIAVFRPPRSDRWWAWAAWFVVCVALIAGASAITIARKL